MQPSGLETAKHTQNFLTAFTAGGAGCPAGEDCSHYSFPVLRNDVFWQNRTFFITVGGLNPNIPGLQNIVTLNPTLNQAGHQTGFCDPKAVYWDIGAYGDTKPSDHSSGMRLSPQYSIITDAGDYPNAHNSSANPNVVSQYCNGARVPPEGGGNGFAVPPGIADTVLPNPLFGLLPSATPDEGNQWINMSYGPLSLKTGSPAVNAGTNAGAPNHDFFGTQRPQSGSYDIGAVELPRTGLFAGGNLPFAPGALLDLLNQVLGSGATGTASPQANAPSTGAVQ
jgi:hypothetical protein